MATKKEEKTEKVSAYPVKVCLKANNPYHNKVVCNGIVVTTTSDTLITNSKMMAKLKKIEKYLIIKTA